MTEDTQLNAAPGGLPEFKVSVCDVGLGGSVAVMVDDFEYVRVNYRYPYTDNATRHALAHDIAAVIKGEKTFASLAAAPAAADATPQDEREEFEAWARAKGMDTRSDEYSAFVIASTLAAWESWQARAALAPQGGAAAPLPTGMGDCPHFPACGHRSPGQCDANMSGDRPSAAPLPADEWVEKAIRLAEELETAAILYGDSEADSDDEWHCRERMLAARAALLSHLRTVPSAVPAAAGEPAQPIDMVLFCPACGMQHIDAPDERTPDWKNEPHRSHLCHGCDHIWRPADVPTNGVAAIKTQGKNDSTPAQAGSTLATRMPTKDELDTVKHIVAGAAFICGYETTEQVVDATICELVRIGALAASAPTGEKNHG